MLGIFRLATWKRSSIVTLVFVKWQKCSCNRFAWKIVRITTGQKGCYLKVEFNLSLVK